MTKSIITKRMFLPAALTVACIFISTVCLGSEKISLRVLYAGLPNTDRAKDFVDFLTKHFQQVETTDYNTFTGSESADFDVAIVDHDGVDFKAPRPRIPRQYARATVTMGVPGGFICSNLSLKTGYL